MWISAGWNPAGPRLKRTRWHGLMPPPPHLAARAGAVARLGRAKGHACEREQQAAVPHHRHGGGAPLHARRTSSHGQLSSSWACELHQYAAFMRMVMPHAVALRPHESLAATPSHAAAAPHAARGGAPAERRRPHRDQGARGHGEGPAHQGAAAVGVPRAPRQARGGRRPQDPRQRGAAGAAGAEARYISAGQRARVHSSMAVPCTANQQLRMRGASRGCVRLIAAPGSPLLSHRPQLEQVRARQKAAWDYGMRVGRINAEVLGSPLASPKADSSGKDQAVGAAAGGCGGSEVHVERGADAADASGLQESCVQAAASGDSRSCTAAEQQPAGVAALGQGIQQQADLHASSASPWPASPHDEARDGTGATPRSVSPVGAGPEPVAAQQPQDSFREASSTIADAQHAAASGSGTCQTTSKPSSPPDAPIAGTRPAARAAPFNPTAASARLLAYALRPHAGGAGIEGRPPWRHPLEGGRMEQQRQQQHLEEQRHASPVRVGAAPEFPAAAAAARRAAKSGVQQGAAAWWGPVAPPLALVPPRVVQAEPAAPPGALQRPEASAAGTQPAQRQRTACKGGQAGAARLAGPVAAAAVTAPGPYGLPDKADLVRIADKVGGQALARARLAEHWPLTCRWQTPTIWTTHRPAGAGRAHPAGAAVRVRPRRVATRPCVHARLLRQLPAAPRRRAGGRAATVRSGRQGAAGRAAVRR